MTTGDEVQGYALRQLATVATIMAATSFGTLAATQPLGAQIMPAPEASELGEDWLRRSAFMQILVGVTEELPYPDANAVILRRAGRFPQEVVLFEEKTAKKMVIARALGHLRYVQYRELCVSEDQILRITELWVPPPQWSKTDTDRATRLRKELRTAAPTTLDGVGPVRMMTVWVKFGFDAGEEEGTMALVEVRQPCTQESGGAS